MKVAIFTFFKLHLVLNYHIKKFNVFIKALDFSFVAVFKVETVECKSRPPRHNIHNCLNQPLLLNWIANVFVNLHVQLSQFDLFELKLHLGS